MDFPSNHIIQISSEALMEMSLATLEAYTTPRRLKNGKNARPQAVETYGLLWGHEVFLPDGDILYSVEKMTLDAMAYRGSDEVMPSEGRKITKDLITSYWPNYSFLGDFHTHPFDHYKDVNDAQGYAFSEVDRQSLESAREEDPDFRISIVSTIASLHRAVEAFPKHLAPHIVTWDFGNYRLWLNACLLHGIPESVRRANPDEEGEEEEGDEEGVVILPNSPHWEETYESENVGEVSINVPSLTGPWAATAFGRRQRCDGKHNPGAI
jgi:hypothetical protein